MDYHGLFRDYHVPFTDTVNRGWVNVTCPFCDDRTFNGGFNIKHDYYHCWKCGAHPHTSALAKVLSIPKESVYPLIEEYEGTSLNVIARQTHEKAPKTLLKLPTDSFNVRERKYLLKRDFDPDYLHDKYGVTGGGSGVWRNRIVIPLILNGRVVSWTARSILSKEHQKELGVPRYKNLSIEQSLVDPKTVMYNLDNARGDKVVITEGAFDVMRLGDGFISSFGTEMTQAQLRQIISRNYSKIYIMFDNEPLAQAKARKYGLQLAGMGADVEVVDAYSDYGKNDGGELTDDEVKAIRRELHM